MPMLINAREITVEQTTRARICGTKTGERCEGICVPWRGAPLAGGTLARGGGHLDPHGAARPKRGVGGGLAAADDLLGPVERARVEGHRVLVRGDGRAAAGPPADPGGARVARTRHDTALPAAVRGDAPVHVNVAHVPAS